MRRHLFHAAASLLPAVVVILLAHPSDAYGQTHVTDPVVTSPADGSTVTVGPGSTIFYVKGRLPDLYYGVTCKVTYIDNDGFPVQWGASAGPPVWLSPSNEWQFPMSLGSGHHSVQIKIGGYTDGGSGPNDPPPGFIYSPSITADVTKQ